VPEGLSPSEVGKEIAEHREHTTAEPAAEEHGRRDRWVAIVEAVLLSVVALLAAWSGYSAAKWGTESSLSLAKASGARSQASLALIQANQIRTLDSVSFNAAETVYAAHNPLAAVLFLVGIGSRFPVRAARYGLVGVAAALLAVSVLLTLPGPPS
jgi:hypothetical protein